MWYCREECQTEDWNSHQQFCRREYSRRQQKSQEKQRRKEQEKEQGQEKEQEKEENREKIKIMNMMELD